MAGSRVIRSERGSAAVVAQLRSFTNPVRGSVCRDVPGHVLALVVLVGLAACAAPAGPSPAVAPTPGASPAAGDVTFETVTPPDDQLAFVPNAFSAAPGASITVNYVNDSRLPHNIRFFAGPDPNAVTIATTEIGAGPDNLQTVTFTPEEPGEYFFHCDVHPQQMQGTLTVEP